MGLEARCSVVYKGQRYEGLAHLDSEALQFRGGVRLRIMLRDLRKAEAKGTDLHVRWGTESAVFELGPAAPQWAEKIIHPPSLLDKLGVKADTRVAAVGGFSSEFLEELRSCCQDASVGSVRPATSLILFLADQTEDLAKAARLIPALAADGGLWVVYPKGQPHITQETVMTTMKGAGLVDVKVASFSPTHTALKFVIPVQKRGAARGHK
jgi:hypothetical protein